MRCDWTNDPNAPLNCHVVDLDTGDLIRYCTMADEEAGEYEALVELPDGRFQIGPDGRVVTAKGKARLKIRPGPPPRPATRGRTSCEHRCEVVPVEAGAGRGCTAELLDRFDSEGWEVLLLTPIAVKVGGSPITGDQKIGQGLFVVMRRPKQ